MSRSPSRQSYSPRSPRSPISPRLRPPDPTIPQTKIDRVYNTFLGIPNSKLTSLPPQATAPYLLSLDLEKNQLKSSALQKLPKNLTTINLVNNPLLDLSLPLLKLLRSISLDSCGLTSFEGFPAFPQLRFLSISNNKIKNFKGLPILMRLEYFNIAGNAFDFSPKISISAVGSISLNTFNDVELTDADLVGAFTLSPLVGYSLRQGRDPTPCETPEEEVRKSQNFLTAKLAAYLKSKEVENPILSLNSCQYENDTVLICPFEPKSIKWYRTRSPDRGSEWVSVPLPPEHKQPNILPVTMLLRMHLVKCEFVLDDGKTYFLFTDYPIGHQSEDLCLPFPLDPVIAGLPLEGSLISLIPLPLPARAAWLRKEVTIAEDVTSILLTNHEIGFVITCLLQPYCPNYPSVAFATVFVETEIVDPILPTVSGVTFPENLLEGVKITFNRKIFPDREGESQILVERARGITEEWVLVAELKPGELSYVPTCEDAGNYLRVSYVPITTEGVVGQCVYFYSSSRVLPTLPQFTNAVIGGLPKTNFQLCAVADYKGGRKGHCSYNWYRSKVPITSQNVKSLDLVATDTPYFTIPADFQDSFIACEMVPAREDEVVGESVYAALTEAVIEDDAPEQFPYPVPDIITAGTELKFGEQVTFYVSNTKGFCGFTEVKRGSSLTLRESWVGHILRLVTNECDFIAGEIKPPIPHITEVLIKCAKHECGEQASIEIHQTNLKPDRFETIWIRCNDSFEKAVAFNTPEYVFQPHDIGFQIKVRVTPFNENHEFLPFIESKLTPTIKSINFDAPMITGKLQEGSTIQVEYGKDADEIHWLRSDTKQKWVDTKVTGISYTISIDDIGKYMRARLHIGESDLIATSNDTVSAAKPVGYVNFSSTEVNEDTVMKPEISYHGGIEGKSIVVWKRFYAGTWEKVSSEKSYKVTKEDIGSRLRFIYTPVRNDNVKGEPITVDFGTVSGKNPAVKDVKVRQNDRGFIECTGTYTGGVEGSSYFLWHATDKSGKTHNIGKTDDREIFPPVQLVGLEVDATYCPIRDDGVEGEQVRSSNRVVVKALPTVESIDLLVKDGIVQVGQVMRCKAVCSEGAKATYCWYRGDGQANWELIPGADKCDYTPNSSDAGYYVLCLAAPVNKDGWIGKGISAATPTPVEPGDLKLEIIPQKARATNKEMYWTGAVLKTNVPTSEEVSWEREKPDGTWMVLGDYVEYTLTANDIGTRIRAAIGDLESQPTPQIVINPDIGSFVNAIVRAKSFTFKAKAASGSSAWEFFADENSLTMKSKRGKHEKIAKWSAVKVNGVEGSKEEIELWMDASTKFHIIPQIQGDSKFKPILQKNAYDFIVYTIRLFINKYTDHV